MRLLKKFEAPRLTLEDSLVQLTLADGGPVSGGATCPNCD